MQKKKKKERSDRAGIKDIRERRNWVRFLKAAAASRGAVYFRGVLGRAKRGCAGESLSSADKLKDGNSVSRVLTPRSLLQRRQQNQILWSESRKYRCPLPSLIGGSKAAAATIHFQIRKRRHARISFEEGVIRFVNIERDEVVSFLSFFSFFFPQLRFYGIIFKFLICRNLIGWMNDS